MEILSFLYHPTLPHYPLGHSYTEEGEAYFILGLTAKYQIYIVEDDYLGDLDLKWDKPFIIWIK